MSYSEDFKIFVATIYGEASNSSEISWKVIAFSIKNRVGFGVWKSQGNTTGVIAKTGYDAYTQKNDPYRQAKNELDSGKITSLRLKKMIELVEPIFYGRENDFTDGIVFYYSPKAQKALHAKDPNRYTSEVPDWVTKERVHQVFIKGTEKDDFAWYKVLRTKLFLTFVDEAAKPLEGHKVDIVFADQKRVSALSSLVIDANGKIKSFDIADNLGARFKVDDVLVKDSKSKEIKIVGDGKDYSAVIVVNNGKGGIKSKTDKHDQRSAVSAPQEEKTSGNYSQEKTQDQTNKDTGKKDVNFNIKIIDSDNRPIPNMAYFLKYKGNDKKHAVGTDGIERNIIAESGQTVSVEISGKDARQAIKSFTASGNIPEQIVKFELHHFEILFRHKISGKAISHLNLIQTYRGKQYDKQTNSEGKILVKAMPGFELNYKLRDGRNLLTINVDKNKGLRIIDVDSNAIEQAAKNLKADIQLPKSENQEDNTEKSASKQDVKTEDQTSKRDKMTSISSDGHPKTVVNDSGEAEFTVLTYDEKTNQLFSGGNYIIEYNGNKRMHVSGTRGLGKKVHKAEINQEVKIFILDDKGNPKLWNKIKIQSNMKDLVILLNKLDTPTLKISGKEWCGLFLQSSSLDDLVEPFKSSAIKFIGAMRKAGIVVNINTTWRPSERSYLMYYSVQISRGIIKPDRVPAYPGVGIDWTHKGDNIAAIKAAKEMHSTYGIGNNPVGKPGRSNHNNKKAVDMKITNYKGKIIIIDGVSTKITSWSTLTKIGKELGIIWFGDKDKPHWSDTGR